MTKTNVCVTSEARSYTLTQYDNMTDEQLGCPHHKQLDEQEERTLRLIANYDDDKRIVIERSGSIDIYEAEDQ